MEENKIAGGDHVASLGEMTGTHVVPPYIFSLHCFLSSLHCAQAWHVAPFGESVLPPAKSEFAPF
jgi:hypothetical protein